MRNRKLPTASEVREWLQTNRLSLPPLRFRLKKTEPRYPGSYPWDFEIEVTWANQKAIFAVEYKNLSTPKGFNEALRQCRATVLPRDRYPLVLMPYLRESQLEELESQGFSGVDWCGNGVVIVKDRFRVFRSGGRNQFLSYSPIKNIFRKNTSMVARVFLTESQFESVQDVLKEIHRLDVLARATSKTPMALGTVSKALKQLGDELIIGRDEGIQLLQADKLLDQLQKSYEPIPSPRRVRLKVDCAFEQLPQLVSAKIDQKSSPAVATGLSSVSRYATMQRADVISVYCPEVKRVQAAIGGREADRFPNLELIETGNQPVYFDARWDGGFYWASPVQTYLELMSGDKRDRETADQVRDHILRLVKRSG